MRTRSSKMQFAILWEGPNIHRILLCSDDTTELLIIITPAQILENLEENAHCKEMSQPIHYGTLLSKI